MYKMRWVNETGGEWFGDRDGYESLVDAEITAREYFADDECAGDVVQAWEVDADGEPVSHTAVSEWSNTDF